MRKIVVAGALALIGCQGQTHGPELGEGSQEIVGADNWIGTFDALCRIDVAPPPDDQGTPRQPFYCSCTLIDTQVIITAATCLYDNVEADKLTQPDDINITFGTAAHEFEEIVFHRYYDPENGGGDNLALVRLKTAPAAQPVVLSDVPLGAEHVASGTDCTLGTTDLANPTTGCVGLFGLGETGDGMPNSAPRAVGVPIELVTDKHILAGSNQKTTCKGDSGGPVMADFGNGPVLVAVTGFQTVCGSGVRRARVDRYLDTFIYPYLDQYGGNCPTDSVCSTTDCRTPDRDCAENECLWGNTCATDCPTRDWDCELGKSLGEICESSGECEQGRCGPAADAPDHSYCTAPCHPDFPEVCPTSHECVEDGNGGYECVYLTPSPGAQGASCDVCPPGVASPCCHSGICEEGICVDECATQDDCPEGFTCGPSTVEPGAQVCLGEVRSGGGGFCSANGGADPRGIALLGLLIVLMLGRRRRA